MAPDPDLLRRRLLVVTGKGGVGKTTVAAALAEVAAGHGARVLVCELDAKGDLAASFEAGSLGFEGREVAPGLRAMEMDTEASLREYLRVQARIPFVARIGPIARAFDFVATAAPGVRELLTVGKLAWEVREDHYDLVVADATASGHVVGQLAAPAAIRELVRVGMVRDQLDWMLDILEDPAATAAVVVATPEEMPVVETLELVERVREEAHVALGAVVVNRVLPEPFTRREAEVFADLRDHRGAVVDRFGAGAGPALDATAFMVRRRRAESGHLARLRAGLPAGTPLLLLPHLFGRAGGRRAVRLLAAALADEGGW